MKICNHEIRVGGRFLRIARLDADKYYFLDNPEEVIEAVRNCGVRVDLFTFVQKLPETSPKYQFPMEWDNFAALKISTFDDWWNKQINKKTRNKVRLAEKKGVVVREVQWDDILVQGIWEIYNECRIRQGRRFTHYGKSLDVVRQEEATYIKSSQFIGAFHEDKLIGFTKVVTDESRTQAGLMNILSMSKHKDKSPTNALVAHAVRYCASQGIPYLVYSSFAYGKKQRSTISDFKERNGFERIDVPRYYVPLTNFGRAAFRLGFHRRMVDRFPEPLVAKVRDLRNTWYNRRLLDETEVP